eukprot:m.36658 g.36658  ORF g.36658 m.36658 type:complete len:366 (+) comp11449_c0_seq1:56-1153(+)
MFRQAIQQSVRGYARLTTPYPTIPRSSVRPAQKYMGPKVWTAKSLKADDLRVTLPEKVHKEMFDYVKKVARKYPNVDQIQVDHSQVPHTMAELQRIEKEVIFEGRGLCLLPGIDGIDSIHEMRVSTFIYTAMLGEPLVQNAEGNRSVMVYDRDSSRKMSDGQRYHQSHEGGSLHTDNVNVPDVWESMFLTCLQPAYLGGESIVVSTAAVHNAMVDLAPDAIETLQRDFLWEFRGFSDKFYRAPLLYYNKMGEPCMRYLRDYMESAHKRLNQPLTVDQLRAVDLIDTVAELSEFQLRAVFKKGESLWCNDVQTLHGRTRFIDNGPSKLQYDFSNPTNRLYQRTWVKTDNPSYRHCNQSFYEVLNNA